MMNNMSLQGCREGYGDSHGPAALTIGFKLFLTDPGWAVTVWWCENSKKVPAVDHLCTVYPEHYWQVQIQTYFATSVWSLQKRVETEWVHISTRGKSKTDFLQHGQLSVQNLLPNLSGAVLCRQNIPNGFRTVGRFMQDKEHRWTSCHRNAKQRLCVFPYELRIRATRHVKKRLDPYPDSLLPRWGQISQRPAVVSSLGAWNTNNEDDRDPMKLMIGWPRFIAAVTLSCEVTQVCWWRLLGRLVNQV